MALRGTSVVRREDELRCCGVRDSSSPTSPPTADWTWHRTCLLRDVDRVACRDRRSRCRRGPQRARCHRCRHGSRCRSRAVSVAEPCIRRRHRAPDAGHRPGAVRGRAHRRRTWLTPRLRRSMRLSWSWSTTSRCRRSSIPRQRSTGRRCSTGMARAERSGSHGRSRASRPISTHAKRWPRSARSITA